MKFDHDPYSHFEKVFVDISILANADFLKLLTGKKRYGNSKLQGLSNNS
jgi:hypothetical protein